MIDDDGKTRFYPQSLAKQLHSFQLPEFQPVDIKASFNSRNSFWYPRRTDDRGQPGQPNFLHVAVHEFVHGLGLASSWSEYVKSRPRGLTPLPQYQNPEGNFQFNGFHEDVFDRYLIDPATNASLSKWTDELNKFMSTHGTEFSDEQDFGQKFSGSADFDIAKRAMQLATKRRGLAFFTRNRTIVFLESSLRPYIPGASISHLDFDTYTGTADFLMRHKMDDIPGETHWVDSNGGIRLIGPRVLAILETLGYTINNDPQSVDELMP
ncbi:hypothetical protein K493DRAFT_304506 [Basidiobolus meristosporus CBS 931.73]|uniref:Uncharacterized protein n=1 Tax=Basidiobolus meristosporus CBS 931.73 TaxID=1314790 RepID=A0A1Y1XZK1_9FUNG|nr:hypothetical protein K493DRAFT_304506 [Basidiobolus meristosporus CBS 931.73]|eukprot:ORX90916.1 hypothetical protein K493DRAFT_304506 [Basidiobolus meristosporus CBS 931.73]